MAPGEVGVDLGDLGPCKTDPPRTDLMYGRHNHVRYIPFDPVLKESFKLLLC